MDVGRYGDILQESFPDLNVTGIRYLGGGTYRVFEAIVDDGRRLIFRFPHGGDGGVLLQRERLLSHTLAARLPVPVPRYEFYAEDCPSFAQPVAGYPRLEGTCVQDANLGKPALHRLASDLGSFLSALHNTPPRVVQALALPYLDSLVVAERQRTVYREVMKHAYPLLNERERTWTTDLFSWFLSDSTSHDFEPVLIHGDLDSSNILCDPADGRLVGVLDFEEACFGDPAWDFCVLLAEHGQAFFQTMVRHYHLFLDVDFEDRVAFHAKRVLYHELLYGLKHGENRFLQHALERLRRAMDGQEPIGGWLGASTAESRITARYPS
jgi:aminoglycoside 2''-phosphotransferase